MPFLLSAAHCTRSSGMTLQSSGIVQSGDKVQLCSSLHRMSGRHVLASSVLLKGESLQDAGHHSVTSPLHVRER